MKKTIQFLWLLCAMAAVLPAWGQHERLYVQTDKNFYVAGEDMMLHIIGTDESGCPLSLSRIAYVELLGDADNTVRMKVELKDGKGTVSVPLPLRLASGTYSLVAYTRWMRNEGERFFFHKDVKVFNSMRYLPGVDRVEFTDSCSKAGSFVGQGNITVTAGKRFYEQRERVTLSLQGVPEDACVTVSVTRADACPGISDPEEIRSGYPGVSTPMMVECLPELEGMLVESEWIPDEGEESTPLRPNLSIQGDSLHYYAGQPAGGRQVIFYTPSLPGMKEVVAGSYSKGRLRLKSPFVATLPEYIRPMYLCKEMESELAERCLAVQVKRFIRQDTAHIYGRGIAGYNRFAPHWSYDLDQYRRFPTLEETFIEFMPGVGIAHKEGHRRITLFDDTMQKANQGNTLVILDGVVITDHEALLAYNPRLVKWVDVYTGSYVFGGHVYNGILSLRTPNRTLAGFRLPDSSVITEYEGVQPQPLLPQEEYPADVEKEMHVPDLRHTLFWNPKVKSADTMLEFTTSDLCGTFIVTVEGITSEGKVINGTTSFEVGNRYKMDKSKN